MHFRKSSWVKGSIKSTSQQLFRVGYLTLKLINDKINSVKNASYVAKSRYLGALSYAGIQDETSVNRRGWRLPRKRTSSVALIGFFSLLSTLSYFSFTIYKEKTVRFNSDKVLSAENSVNQALKSLDQYLELIAKRIAGYPGNDQKITEILNMDFFNLFEGSFPAILALSYNPIADDKFYSRLGIVKESRISTDFLSANNPKEHVFLIEKQIEGLGAFTVHISLKHLLSNYFIKTDALPETADPQGFSVNIGGKSEYFKLDRPHPSFFNFLKRYANNLLLLVIAAIGFTFFGGISVYYIIRKHNKVLRFQKEELINGQLDLHQLCAEKQELIEKKDLSLEGRKKDASIREELLRLIITRLQDLACEGLSTNSVASNLLNQEYVEPKTVCEIARMVDRANIFLDQISTGVPIKKKEIHVDLKKTMLNILSAYEDKIAFNNVTFLVEDKLQKLIQTDPGLLQLVLYSVVKNALESYLSHLIIQIDSAPESGYIISFIDNGHVADPIASEAKKNILSLSRQEMLELTQVLGWKITWGELDGKNRTILWLPDTSLSKGKVFNMAEFRKHG
jgi:hypothetical protein